MLALADPQLGFPCMSPARCMVHDMLSLGCSVAGAVLIMVMYVNQLDSNGSLRAGPGLDGDLADSRYKRNVLYVAMWMLAIVM